MLYQTCRTVFLPIIIEDCLCSNASETKGCFVVQDTSFDIHGT